MRWKGWESIDVCSCWVIAEAREAARNLLHLAVRRSGACAFLPLSLSSVAAEPACTLGGTWPSAIFANRLKQQNLLAKQHPETRLLSPLTHPTSPTHPPPTHSRCPKSVPTSSTSSPTNANSSSTAAVPPRTPAPRSSQIDSQPTLPPLPTAPNPPDSQPRTSVPTQRPPSFLRGKRA